MQGTKDILSGSTASTGLSELVSFFRPVLVMKVCRYSFNGVGGVGKPGDPARSSLSGWTILLLELLLRPRTTMSIGVGLTTNFQLESILEPKQN